MTPNLLFSVLTVSPVRESCDQVVDRPQPNPVDVFGRVSTTIPSRISPALRLIHYADLDGVSEEMAANTVGLSQSRFRRVFKDYTGVTFHRYVVQERMQRAAQMLRTTAMSVDDVVKRIGVTDRSHFMRDFKRTHGMTPGRFRQTYGVSSQGPKTTPRVAEMTRRAGTAGLHESQLVEAV